MGVHWAAELEVVEAETASRRWRLMLLVEVVFAVAEALVDEEAAVVIFATAVGAMGEPVMDVVVKTALGLCADIWDSTDAMAASVFWMVTGQVVQTLLGLLEMAAASAIAASTGRAKSWKRIVCLL
jgi:hypothetical protein